MTLNGDVPLIGPRKIADDSRIVLILLNLLLFQTGVENHVSRLGTMNTEHDSNEVNALITNISFQHMLVW